MLDMFQIIFISISGPLAALAIALYIAYATHKYAAKHAELKANREDAEKQAHWIGELANICGCISGVGGIILMIYFALQTLVIH